MAAPVGMASDELHAFPWRICLAGGWLDQPWVSKVHSGCVVVVNIEAHDQFSMRSGLATSTRSLGMELWDTLNGGRPPRGLSRERLARILFNVENPIDCEYVSGSQDALGLMLPGVNRLNYDGGYWPSSIEACGDDDCLRWLERVLWLVPLAPRPPGYDPLTRKNVAAEIVAKLAAASSKAWEAVLSRDAPRLGHALRSTLAAWEELLPDSVPADVLALAKPYDAFHGYHFSGAGGGFLLVVADPGAHVPGGFQITITTPVPEGGLSPSHKRRRERHQLSDALGQLLMALCAVLLVYLLAQVLLLGIDGQSTGRGTGDHELWNAASSPQLT